MVQNKNSFLLYKMHITQAEAYNVLDEVVF